MFLCRFVIDFVFPFNIVIFFIVNRSRIIFYITINSCYFCIDLVSTMLHKIFHQNIFEVIDLNSAMLMTASVFVVGYVWNCLKASRRQKVIELENEPHRVLLITAHPDDECMFFGPVIQKLSKMKNVQFYLMCLSNGNLLTL